MSGPATSTARRGASTSSRAVTVYNGEPGTHWTNDTGVVQYQFVASLINTCGRCLQYHLAISRWWGIPLHYGCNCHQVAIKRGATSPHAFCDYRELLDRMPHSQQVKAIGGSAYRLLKEGIVTWEEIVTRSRIRTLQEVVARNKLTVKQMVDAGVRPDIARRAYESVHTPEADLIERQRRKLIQALEPGSIAQQTLLDELSKRISQRVVMAPPPSAPPSAMGAGLPTPPAPPLGAGLPTPPVRLTEGLPAVVPTTPRVVYPPSEPPLITVPSTPSPGEMIPPRPLAPGNRVEPGELKAVLKGTKIAVTRSEVGTTKVTVTVPPAPKPELKPEVAAPPKPVTPTPPPGAEPPKGSSTTPSPKILTVRGFGRVTGSEIDEIHHAVEHLPAVVRDALRDHGVTVSLGERVSSVNAKIAALHPRHYPKHQTFENAGALYSPESKTIIVAKTKKIGKLYVPLEPRLGAFRHEAGHAFDEAMGHPTHGRSFAEAYNEDVGRLTAKQREDAFALLQPGTAGLEETFCEVFAYLAGGGVITQYEVRGYFPLCAAIIVDLISGRKKR